MELQKKKYKRPDELIEKLKSKGIVINNENTFKNSLNQIGYYKLINGYRKPFMTEFTDEDNNIKYTYKKRLKIEEIVSLYNFDINLRFLTLKYLLKIEIFIKNILSNLIAEKYCVCYKTFFEEYNFMKTDMIEGIKKSIDKHVARSVEKYEENGKILNKAIIHYHVNYEEIPIWLVVNLITFGDISNLFSGLLINDKIEIAKKVGVRWKSLKSFLQNLTYFRNVCAHSERLYCFKTQNKITIKPYKKLYKTIFKNNTPEIKNGLQDYFSLIIMFKIILKENDFNSYRKELLYCLKKLKSKINKSSYKKIKDNLGLIEDWTAIFKVNKKY